MSIFTTPIVINDGVADSTFVFRFQVPDKSGKLIIGEYFEPAASLASQTKLMIRQDISKSNQRRSLCSFGEQITVTDVIGRKPIVLSISLLYHPEHAKAAVSRVANIGLNALREPGALDSFLQGQI